MQTETYVANKGQRTQIAGLEAIFAHCHTTGFAELGLVVGHIHPVDLGGIHQALNVLLQTEDAGTLGGIVGADPFKHRGAVMQGVGHDVNLRLVPLNQFTVKPDIFGGF